MLIAITGLVAVSGYSNAEELELTSATIADINAAYDAGITAEQVVTLYQARIEAYDNAGPAITAVITLNPNALERARELDEERRRNGRRCPGVRRLESRSARCCWRPADDAA